MIKYPLIIVEGNPGNPESWFEKMFKDRKLITKYVKEEDPGWDNAWKRIITK